MPAHSTMCICHIGLALTSHNLLRIKNSVYVHNSLFVPHKFSFSSPISSRTHQFFSYFRILLVREMRKGKFSLLFLGGVSESKKEEKGKSEKMRQQGIYKIMYILMCSACLCLHAFLSLGMTETRCI